MGISERLTITDVAKSLGITPRTIMRWEKASKIRKPKRDWRGWRFYSKEDAEQIRQFFESTYEYNDGRRQIANFARVLPVLILSTSLLFSTSAGNLVYGKPGIASTPGITETATSVNIDLDKLPVVGGGAAAAGYVDAVKYTLGPDDVISIEVRRHPEFSGQYNINSEGKIEYKFVGDIEINGLTKLQVKNTFTDILSEFIIEPEIDVTIVAYLSKVFYVVGEVGRPGKFYMRGNTISVRQALFQAGLPTHAAAMRRCRLISPNDTGKDNNYDKVNVYKLLYEGDLSCNLEMQPNEVLYIPATMMAKMIRVISPATNVVGQTAGTAALATAI